MVWGGDLGFALEKKEEPSSSVTEGEKMGRDEDNIYSRAERI